MLFFEVLAMVALAATLTRYVRQSPAMAPLRVGLARIGWLDKLLQCPHCLSFWIAAAGTAALWSWQGLTILEASVLVLLGWRGAFYVNRALDQRHDRAERRAAEACSVCGAAYDEATFLERGGLVFCSTTCWFDYLRARPTSRQSLVGRNGEILRQEVYPLSYKDVSNEEAKALLDGGDCVYIDVRSVPEFQNGHPAGAANVPIFHREPMGMVPNGDFLTVMEVHFPKDAKLLVGCQSGQRSLRAAEALVAAGYQDVSNVRGGYGGARTFSGEVVDPGWFEQGFATDFGDPEERSYQALAGGRRGSGS